MKQLLQGKRAKDIMRREAVTVEATSSVSEAVRAMNERGVGACVIVSAIQDALGIFTERDLMGRVVVRGLNPVTTKIIDVMTPNLVCAQAADDAWELLTTMVEANFRHLPVMDGRRLIGIVSMKEFCKHLVKGETTGHL
ncbi:MAG: CBS domain-containing protein [Deltaproteobacteria bacterium]|nr:CBS domain-containing protein [Deltaproteobacteria bacterium]